MTYHGPASRIRPQSFGNQPSVKYFKRGDILWLPLSQDLSPPKDTNAVRYKTRPFIVLNAQAKIYVDAHGNCIQPTSLLGVVGTSKDYLVEGRPHIAFTIHGENKLTYAYLDSLRTVDCQGLNFSHHNWLPKTMLPELMNGLDKVLQPEQKFFRRRLFQKPLTPGQIWDFQLPTMRGAALILLRRGRFYVDDEDGTHENAEKSEEEQSSADSNNEASNTSQLGVESASHGSRYTPYLVATFRQASGITTLRGIGWDEIDIRAIHERSFIKRQGELTEETVGILLNNLRERIGLPPITYHRPIIKSAFNKILWPLFLLKIRF